MAFDTSCKSIWLTRSKVFSGIFLIFLKRMESDLRLPELGESTRRNFVFSGFSQFEKFVEVARCLFADLVGGKPTQFAQFSRRFRDKRRLIPLTAMRHWSQIGRVGLD